MGRTGLSVSVLALAALSGCAGGPAGQNSGGAAWISDMQISESASELRIVAIGDRGANVGQLILRVGEVALPDEGRVAFGRSLAFQVGGDQGEHVNEGLVPVTLPMPPVKSDRVEQFLLDPRVASALARWDVTITTENPKQANPGGEHPYAGTCTYGFNPSCGPTSCCEQDESGGTYEYVCCGSSVQAIIRTCSADTNSNCGPNGPNHCAVCWAANWVQYCQSVIGQYCQLNWCAGDLGSCGGDSDCCNTNGSCNPVSHLCDDYNTCLYEWMTGCETTGYGCCSGLVCFEDACRTP
jgi:hypothetical protein